MDVARERDAPGTVHPSSSQLASFLFSYWLDVLSEGILGTLVSNRFGQSVQVRENSGRRDV
jgi:hypothetical protein